MEHLDPWAVKFLEGWPLFDNSIVEHHFTPYMRDYDMAGAAAPDDSGSYLEGRYRFRFTHCTLVKTTSTVADKTWVRSWSEHFTDYEAWEQAGGPEGYVWGVNFMNAYPGARYLPDSELAADWTRRFFRSCNARSQDRSQCALDTTCLSSSIASQDCTRGRDHTCSFGDRTT